jgi:hypothetical protein
MSSPGKCFHHRSQCIESDIQVHTKFRSCNPPICADKMIEALFILWADSCARSPGMWPLSHVTVTTAETHHTPSQCAHSHCLGSINVQQMSMNVNGLNFFRMDESNDTPLLRTNFHIGCNFARLLVCCRHTATKLTNYWQEGSTSTAIPPACTSNSMGQQKKIGAIIFGAPSWWWW